MFQNILNNTAHRDSLLPRGSWVMMQRWEHLLFLHQRMPQQVLRSYLPPGLELDTYDGDAWLSIIPFRVSKVRFRGLPSFPFVTSFLEVNVRTYVKRRGRRGVYFFSLDADNLPVVIGAGMATLPYYYANISMNMQDGAISFYSERKGKKSGVLRALYKPDGERFYPEKGGLESWLLERYFLWTYKFGKLYRCGLHHNKWAIQKAQTDIKQQRLTPWDGSMEVDTLAHYTDSKTALIWMIRKEG
ncbi:hypothetical protein GCM10007063_22680 [Lentibacillus kapialis]|uniref:DUF2071 domain-containing protein n=1 Tax=Lentibacillus kapialis TaxID=340214 RepID=A0A917PYN6_9BACI|nr:DUF2071 domain-containing protein [Lentibacillus kapialis]GGJ99756.1 hypothetical protein GCM10007063_22680 [Lentibacillus kapialis]